MTTSLQAKLGTTFKVGPWTVRLDVRHDEDTTPADSDCYTPKQVAAWHRDEWEFVGIVAKAYLEGVELGSDSLWGIERGYLPVTDEDDNLTADVDYVDVYDDAIEGVIAEAIHDAGKTLRRLSSLADVTS